MLKKDINKGVLAVIQVSDNEHSDYNALCITDQEELQLRRYKREIHKRQFIASRLTLAALLKEKYALDYKGLRCVDGKPLRIGNLTPSLSHSVDLVAVAVSQKKIGVDIQAVLPKISRVAPRVCNQAELNIAPDEVRQTILWSAKEALYKYAQVDGLDFKTALHIDSLSLINNKIICSGRIISNSKTEQIQLHGQLIENYVLVYTT